MVYVLYRLWAAQRSGAHIVWRTVFYDSNVRLSMKSILQEANSIERAIDKAWNEAGKPKEFTIKVLDEGERNFLGLSRRPAIVSIIFKPEKATNPMPVRKEKEEKTREQDRQERRDRSRDRDAGASPRRTEAEQPKMRRYAGTDEQRAAFHKTQAEGWSDEWQDFVTNEIRELLRRMGMSTDMEGTVTADKVFTISFKKALLDNDDEQRMLFATFSYLAIQLLKRQYKSRFVGYRIAVTGPKADGSAMSADSDEPASAMSGPRTAPEPRQQSRESRDSGTRENNGRGSRDRGERSERSDRGERSERSDRGERRPRFDRPQQPRVQESASHDDDILADQMRFAQQQLQREEQPSMNERKTSTVPLKKDQKYQPFFVLEDEESGK